MHENDIGTAIVGLVRGVRVYEVVLTRTVSGLREGEISWRPWRLGERKRPTVVNDPIAVTETYLKGLGEI